ncbi:MAG: holo-ACP synthase [Desulfovibrio sp.]|jgi:holo-[acyl-carrier protein] synthase|nr:holo-ACP synthase [Desulfovibrio sp.]
MIVGLGVDLVELSRIRRSLERFGDHFIRKLLHPSELTGMFTPEGAKTMTDALLQRMTPFVAARFAAKEAGAKALGTGFAKGLGPRDIRVLSLASGKPAVSFHGQALTVADALGVKTAHLSLSHARESAVAVVILETDGLDRPQREEA